MYADGTDKRRFYKYMTYLLLFVCLILTPVMLVTELVMIILFGLTSFFFNRFKFQNYINMFLERIWQIPFNIGLLWYYCIRKILIPEEKGVLIKYPFKKNELILWNDISSIELYPYGMRAWVINIKENDPIAINIDSLENIKHAARYNGIKVTEEYR